MDNKHLKKLLLELLEGSWAHASLDAITKNVPKEARGKKVRQIPYSLWELLEHIRLTQKDILKYIENKEYEPLDWPDGYWPKSSKPLKESDWNKSVNEIKQDKKKLEKIIKSGTDLLKQLPQGETGHCVLREILVLAQHTSYHLGQMILIRRLLKIW
jgi:hypothetical protein